MLTHPAMFTGSGRANKNMTFRMTSAVFYWVTRHEVPHRNLTKLTDWLSHGALPYRNRTIFLTLVTDALHCPERQLAPQEEKLGAVWFIQVWSCVSMRSDYWGETDPVSLEQLFFSSYLWHSFLSPDFTFQVLKFIFQHSGSSFCCTKLWT